MNLLAQAWLLGGGLVAAVCDLRERRVPNAVIGALLAAWPLFGIGQPGGWWAEGVAGFMLVGLPLLALALTAGLGMGDVKLGAVVGLYLGPGRGLLAVAAGTVAGGLVHALLVLLGRRTWAGRGSEVPFAPFLTLGALGTTILGARFAALVQGVVRGHI
jgi:leader peptidase (prepilin peptidase)/N-methyltransferase